MKYDNLSKEELLLKIEKLKEDLIKSNSINKKLEKAEDIAQQQNFILNFLKKMAIPSADKSSVDEFSKILLKSIKEYTGAVLAIFSYYHSDKKELLLLHIDAEQDLLKTALKIAGDKVVKTASPVDDETYRLILQKIVGKCGTFTEITFGVIPGIIDKAIRRSTGIDRLYPIAHVIEGELYGTSVLAFKKGQTSPSIELLESYAHLMSVSLRRYNAENALKLSESRYKNLVETASDAIYLMNEDGIVVDTNQSAIDVSGKKRHEIVGHPIDLVDPNYPLSEFLKFWKAVPFNKQIVFESTHQRKNGTLYPVELSAKKYRLNEKTFYYGVARDITERKQAEAEILNSGANLNALIENTNDFIYSIDKNYKLLTANSEFLEDVEPLYNERLSVGSLLLDKEKLPTELYKEWKKTYDRALYGDKFKTDLETKIRPDKKKFLELSYNPIINNKNEVTGVSVFGRDVTERKQAEKEIAETKQFYENIIEGVQDGIWVTDDNDIIYFANAAMEQIAGIPREKIQGNNVLKDFPEETTGELISFYNQAKEEKRPIWYEIKVKTPADKNTWQNGWLIPKYEKDTFKGIICTIRDITVRKQTETELKEKSEFIDKIIDSSALSTWISDDKGTAIRANPACFDFFGATEEEVIGKYNIFKDSVLEKLGIIPDIQKVFEKGESANLIIDDNFGEVDHVSIKNATHKIVNSIFTPILDINGKVSNVIIQTIDLSEIKKAEKIAIEEKNKAQQYLDIADVMLLSIDTKGTVQLINPKGCEILGYSKEEILGQNWFDLALPEDQQKMVKEVAQKVFSGEIESVSYYENNIVTKSGKERLIAFHNSVLTDENGYIIGTLSSGEDITERKQAEEELIEAKEVAEENEEKYRLLHENAGLGIGYIRPDGIIISFNTIAAKDMNGAPEDFAGKSIFDIFPEDAAAVYSERLQKAANSDKIEVYEDYVQLPVQEKWFLSTYVRIVNWRNKVLGIQIISQDITNIKQAEVELIKAKEKAEESEKQLKLIADNFGNGMIYQVAMLDENRRQFNYISKNIEELYGCTLQEAKEDANLIYGKIHPGDINRLIEKEKEALRNMSTFETEARVITPDGNIRWAYYISKPRVINGIVCWDGIEVDITKRKQMELELRKAKEKAEESDRLKSAFLANMSHEIRTPMNGILGFTNLLKEPELTGKDQQKFISIIEKSGHRMLNTVNDIIDISKIEAGQVDVIFSKINLNKQLDELLEFFLPEAKKKNIQLSITSRVSDQQANCKSDKEKLNSIFTNFIKNAIKYTPTGSIEFGYTIKESDKQNELKFYVKDTGIGIPKERQEAIFNRFEQADIEDKQVFEGSGLGLAISKAYVEMLGGKIWVESEAGVGSQFYFTIPCQTNNKEIPKQNTEDSNKPLSAKKDLKILIAEDDELAITFLRIVLKEYTKETLIAKTGTEAVKMCRDNRDIDLILMDIKMPELNGYEATRQIREFNKEVFIVAQTAYAQSGDHEKSIQAGCNDHISKPINKKKLLEILSNRF